MTTKKYSLTDEHRAQLEPWRDRWIANGLNTAPMDDRDRDVMQAAITGIYGAADLPPPNRIVFCASPIGGAIAASVASGVWWLRDNPKKHCELFGRDLAEHDLLGAIGPAVAFVAKHGVHRAMTLEPLPKQSPKAPTATDAATDAATCDATHAAAAVATRPAVPPATKPAAYPATAPEPWPATHAATHAATYAATYA